MLRLWFEVTSECRACSRHFLRCMENNRQEEYQYHDRRKEGSPRGH